MHHAHDADTLSDQGARRGSPGDFNPPPRCGIVLAMISRADIQDFVDRVAQHFHPAAVILFGSYAYGRPTADSDVDLLVVMPHRGPSAKAATRIRLACPRDFPLDLIVRSPAELRRRLEKGDSFLRQVMNQGLVLHESRDARMGR
jgi:predicted nucleotidyltransferase